MLVVGAALGVCAIGITGCNTPSKEALEHPKFTTPPREAPGAVAAQSAPRTNQPVSGGQTSFGPGGQPGGGNTHF